MDQPELGLLRVLFFKDGDYIIVQCLEYDICAQGKNLPDAECEFVRSYMTHVIFALESGSKPLENIPKAPQEFWDRFETSQRVFNIWPMITADIPEASKYYIHNRVTEVRGSL